MIPRLQAALQSPLKISWTEQSAPSIFVCTSLYALGLAVYFSSRGRTRDGEEHGSATWGSAREVNRQFAQKQSKILTRHVRLGLDSRRHRRSLNVLVIGGSGAAKTRSYVLPNILEANTNYVITDPKSEVLLATGGYADLLNALPDGIPETHESADITEFMLDKKHARYFTEANDGHQK